MLGIIVFKVASMNAVESRANEASDPSIPLHFIEVTRLFKTVKRVKTQAINVSHHIFL